MNSICPYCNVSDTYYAYFIVSEDNDGSGFNKCCNCDKWSKFVFNIGQIKLPENITDAILEQKINEIN